MAGVGFGIAVLGVIAALVLLGMYWLVGLVWTMLLAFILVCALMMLVILIQKPRGGGLSGAFGGAGGGSQAVFGARVGDVLTWVTVGFFVTFLGLAMGLTYAIRADVGPVTPVAAEQTQEENEAPQAITDDDESAADVTPQQQIGTEATADQPIAPAVPTGGESQ